MKLSIITVNLNNRDGLTKTIESISCQSFSEFEFILVDGASTDGSLEVIRQFDPAGIDGFHWISEKDSGIFQAMNKGIRLASGEYLLFLNSGDFLVHDKVLEEVFSAVHTADILAGRCRISQKGTVIHITSPPEKITFGYLYYTGLAHQATFIKKALFDQSGYYREDFRYNSDVEFWYRALIFNVCSSETLDTVISDYNTSGISSQDRLTEAYKKELEEIQALPFMQLFIPDYDHWRNEQKEMEVMYWIRSKKPLYSLSMLIYKMARWLAKTRE